MEHKKTRQETAQQILVMGSGGYVGSVLVPVLENQAYSVIEFDANWFSNQSNAGDGGCTGGFPSEVLDVRHSSAGKLLPQADSVVYLAAVSNDPMGNRFEGVTHDINAESAVRLAKEAKQAGVRRFIFASSCSMYGEAIDTPRKEADILNPLTAYARSKVWAEQELANLSGEGFQVTALRFATACGASPKLRLDLVLNDFVASAILYKTIEVLSDGTPWRPLIHVADMARAICWALGRKKGGAFAAVNVGSDEWTYQVRELAEIVGQMIPGTTLSINPAGISSPDKRSYKVDFSLFQELAPDHQPVITINEAVRGLETQVSSISFNKEVHFRQASPYIRLNTLEKNIRLGLMDEQLFWKTGSA